MDMIWINSKTMGDRNAFDEPQSQGSRKCFGLVLQTGKLKMIWSNPKVRGVENYLD